MKSLTSLNAVSLFFLLCFMPSLVSAADSDLKISEMTVTTRIAKGNPIDSVKRVSSASIKWLYCFTRITSTEDEDTTIKHVWYHNGAVVGEYTLPVKGAHWRTYSKKLFDKTRTGQWRVEAVDEEGKVLRSVEFRIN